MGVFPEIDEREYHVQTKILARRCREMIMKAYPFCKKDDDRDLVQSRAEQVYGFFRHELNDRAILKRNTHDNAIIAMMLGASTQGREEEKVNSGIMSRLLKVNGEKEQK